MLHLLHYPHELIAERVVFTPADHARIARCRGSHNRLGFAYQMGFLYLTGRFPTQQPLEILDDLLAFVAHELAMDPAAMQDYAQRQATVSAHQEEIRFYLGFRPFDATAREALSRFLIEEATRVEHMPALLARAEEFLCDRRILLPALSTVRRLAGEQREQARHQVYARLMACVPPELPPRLDALLQVEGEASVSPVQVLKAPPGTPSPPALSRLTAKLDQIQATGVLILDLSWLNPNLQKALARHAWQASAHRLRLLQAPQRYTVLVCFLRHTYHETIDQLVDMYQKLMTATYRRAEQDLEAAVTRSRGTLRGTLQSFHLMGQTLWPGGSEGRNFGQVGLTRTSVRLWTCSPARPSS